MRRSRQHADSPSRPPKKAHLRRWLGRSSLRRTTAYVSVVAPSPPRIWAFFSGLLVPFRFTAPDLGGRRPLILDGLGASSLGPRLARRLERDQQPDSR